MDFTIDMVDLSCGSRKNQMVFQAIPKNRTKNDNIEHYMSCKEKWGTRERILGEQNNREQ